MELKYIIEALLFASDKPLSIKRIYALLKKAALADPCQETEIFSDCQEELIHSAIQELREDYISRKSGLSIQERSEGYQLSTSMAMASWVHELFEGPKPNRLSPASLETLAIIAYRQPLSRAEIEEVRGVSVDGVVATLVERRLIRTAGRSEQPGRPLLYETTPEFLHEFGLKNLEELPHADELRTINNTVKSPTDESTQKEDRPVGS